MPTMKTQPKRPKFVAQETREIIAENLAAKLVRAFPALPYKTDQYEALSKRTGVSSSTVQRAAKAEVGITVDVLAQMASGLKCDPADLLIRKGG